MDFRSPQAWMGPLRRGQVLAFAAFLFLIAVAGPAAAGVVVATPADFTVAEGTAFNDVVAMFTDSDESTNAGSFTATIDWGDGSPVTPGTIAQSDTLFFVIGQHTYDDEGTFTVTVVINEIAGPGTATATTTATVTESDVLSGTPTTFSAPSGVSFTTTVATFSDTFTPNTASDFTAMISWGDATMSTGTIAATAPGMYQVNGTHTYAAPGTYSVMVIFSDDAPGIAMAQVTSTAHVAAGLSVTAVNLSTPEGTPFNGTVATFSDSDTTKTPASFAVIINWGDGTTTAGTVTGSSGSFTVNGQHTYADEGSFSTIVTVTEIGAGGLTASATGVATVSESDVLSGSPVTFSAQAGVVFTGAVATFTDTFTGNVPGDFVATIDWGDGNTTAGTVTGGGGTFSVSGTHTYAAAGVYNVVVTLADDAPGTATATTTSTANVSAPIAAVPALDLRGLLLLGMALGAAGLYFLRRA
jgi:PKD repeat protein